MHSFVAVLLTCAGLARASGAPTLRISFNASTKLPPLSFTLRPDLAPRTVAAVVGAIGHACDGCATVYRNEAVPPCIQDDAGKCMPPASCGSIGPCGPYALVQGTLRGLEGTPAEERPLLKRGMVAHIPETSDYFVALDEHESWGHSFTVFGEADAPTLATLERITGLPWHEEISGETVMRMLDHELKASAACVEGEPPPAEPDAAEAGREL